MTTREIAELYAHGLRLREQAAELSQKKLRKKFQCGPKTVSKVANGIPCQLPEEEQALIRACISERDRLKSQAAELTIARLCNKYHVTYQILEAELIAMGVWSEAA